MLKTCLYKRIDVDISGARGGKTQELAEGCHSEEKKGEEGGAMRRRGVGRVERAVNTIVKLVQFH